MKKSRKSIEELIRGSSLEESDKVVLLDLFSRASSEEKKAAAEFVVIDRENLSLINAVYKIKKRAIKNKDSALWHNIILEEIRSLKLIEEK